MSAGGCLPAGPRPPWRGLAIIGSGNRFRRRELRGVQRTLAVLWPPEASARDVPRADASGRAAASVARFGHYWVREPVPGAWSPEDVSRPLAAGGSSARDVPRADASGRAAASVARFGHYWVREPVPGAWSPEDVSRPLAAGGIRPRCPRADAWPGRGLRGAVCHYWVREPVPGAWSPEDVSRPLAAGPPAMSCGGCLRPWRGLAIIVREPVPGAWSPGGR